MTRPAKPDAIAMLAALKPAVATPAPQSGVVPSGGDVAPGVPVPKPRKPKPGARAGTRLIAGHFPVGTLRALKHLMAEEDVTLQALLDEAITDLLTKKASLKLTS